MASSKGSKIIIAAMPNSIVIVVNISKIQPQKKGNGVMALISLIPRFRIKDGKINPQANIAVLIYLPGDRDMMTISLGVK